jgi:hypothetical protein
MSTAYPRNVANSQATYEYFAKAGVTGEAFSRGLQSLPEMQSSSVTLSGSLWQETLMRLAPMASENEIKRDASTHNSMSSQKKQALLELLRSWREGDEEEQRSTWEYLKRVLDEDRLSERKLFP